MNSVSPLLRSGSSSNLKIADHLRTPSIAAVALAFIVICLLLNFPVCHEELDEDGSNREVKPFPSRPVSLIALAASTLASILALLSMTWQQYSLRGGCADVLGIGIRGREEWSRGQVTSIGLCGIRLVDSHNISFAFDSLEYKRASSTNG